jgi:hypothetical protein
VYTAPPAAKPIETTFGADGVAVARHVKLIERSRCTITESARRRDRGQRSIVASGIDRCGSPDVVERSG